jgi:hypothetical protein
MRFGTMGTMSPGLSEEEQGRLPSRPTRPKGTGQ